eukprot:INCI10217.2.p1 GENE.INCI10217.2~~INCI10217.2.p1  ORF type:complete len:758 (-),score=96.23 INCI10217.2:293-2566(-)
MEGTASQPGSSQSGDGDVLTVSYLTDVEGNIDYFRRFVDISEALSFEDVELDVDRVNKGKSGASEHREVNYSPSALVPGRRLVLRTGYAFVFGGDLFDKGPGDLQLAKWLCDLKERYPHRVFLLLGNRDINKMRFLAELESQPPHDGRVETVVGRRLWDQPPFWDSHAPSFLEWLAKRSAPKHHQLSNSLPCLPVNGSLKSGASASGSAGRNTHCDRNVDMSPLRPGPSSQLLQLRWMLECTLGSPSAFEFRRQELQIMMQKWRKKSASKASSVECSNAQDEIGDADVLQSFISSVRPVVGLAAWASSAQSSQGQKVGQSRNSPNLAQQSPLASMEEGPPLPPAVIRSDNVGPSSPKPQLAALSRAASGEGIVLRYIRLGQIGLRLGDTLFVHGAVTDNTLLWVPSWSGLKYRQLPEADGRVWSVQQPSTTFEALAVARANVEQNMASSGTYLDPQTASVDQWLLELETFREKSVADFETRPFWHTSGKLAGARHEHAPVPQSSGLTRKTPAEPDDGDGSGGSPPQLYDSNNASSLIGLDSQRGGEALMAYQSTPATGGRSVVVTAYMRGSHVNHLGPEACRFLLRGNPQDGKASVRRIVVGHKPVGVAPMILKFGSGHTFAAASTGNDEAGQPDEVEVIAADTSFSDPSAADNRGRAVHEVLIHNVRISDVCPKPFQSSSSARPQVKSTPTDSRSEARIHGVLPDGQRVNFFTSDELIGRRTSSDWWVIGKKGGEAQEKNGSRSSGSGMALEGSIQ